MCDIYHNLLNELESKRESISAIEMTPAFHKQLIHFMEHGKPALNINGLPIIFVHGENFEYKFLNANQYRLRIRHNEILSLYGTMYIRLNNIINNGYMINDANLVQDSIVSELKKLVKRLNTIELQIVNS